MKPMLAALAACVALGALRAQSIEAVPDRILADESAAIRASGLQPNELVTLRAEMSDGAGEHWTSYAEFLADARGAVAASKQAPVTGTYKGVSAMGLVWSMAPLSKNVARYRRPADLGVQVIDLKLVRGGAQLAAIRLEQVSIREDVQRIPVREGSLRGEIFLPGGGRHPGVLVLGGSEGGAPIRQAAWLASRGFAALALGYFHYQDLPDKLEAIPLEYFQSALAWMASRPEILGGRLAVMGASRGGELALQLGSMFPRIGAVAAFVPANVRYPACCGDNRVPYAWTWEGRALPYLDRRFSRAPMAVTDAAIAVENTRGPILLISGQDDGVWFSSMMADALVGRLKLAHFAYPVESLKYNNAGHTAGRPEIAPTWLGRVVHPISGREMNPGGTRAGNAESSLDAIPKVLEFLRRSLESALTSSAQR